MNSDGGEVVVRNQHRRRWSLAEKVDLVRRTCELGMSVSLLARQEGIAVCCSSGAGSTVRTL